MHEGVLFSKLKEVWWIDNWKEQWKIESLFSFLKLCPVLEELLITINVSCRLIRHAMLTTDFKICSAESRENKPLSRLKLVKLEAFSSQEEEILLAARIYQEVVGGPVKVV
ncbi:F-box protein-like protein [Drosera capensis]